MNSKRLRLLLSAYVDGELDATQHAEVQAHLQVCPNCSAVLESYHGLGRDIRDLPAAPVPAGMRQAFGQRLCRESGSPPRWLYRLNLRRWSAELAAVVVLVGLALGAYALLRERTAPDRSVVSLVASYPPDKATDVPLDARLTLTFARLMDRASVEDATTVIPETDLAFAWEGETLTIVPFENWQPATVYTLTVGTSSRHADGSPVTEPIEVRFVTAETPPSEGGTNPLGQFGVVWRASYGGPGGTLGYATSASEQLWGATQPFEHGRMVWVDHLEEDHIYVLSYGEDEGSGTWQRYVDTFREGDPESAGFTSPEGMQEPIRGFGKVWRNELGSRDAAIGWALAPEQGYVGEVQPFEHGVMLWCPLEGVIYVLLDDEGWTAHTTLR